MIIELVGFTPNCFRRQRNDILQRDNVISEDDSSLSKDSRNLLTNRSLVTIRNPGAKRKYVLDGIQSILILILTIGIGQLQCASDGLDPAPGHDVATSTHS
jgi:hypothetical protein